MLNIDTSEVFYKNKQDVSIEIVLVRCSTRQRAEKNYSYEINSLHCNWQQNSPAKYMS